MRSVFFVLFLVACTDSFVATEAPIEMNPGELSATDVPVLLLPDQFEDVVITSERVWYGASFRDENVTVYLHGTTAFVDAPTDLGDVAPTTTIRGVGGYATVNEAIRTITWQENGAAYSLDVECASPIDRRCQSADYLIDIAARLETP